MLATDFAILIRHHHTRPPSRVQALLDEKRALDEGAERHWQQQQMQIAVAQARVRELEAAIQVGGVE